VQREVKVAKGAERRSPGDQVLVSIFNQGERVDVIGTSKGHGCRRRQASPLPRRRRDARLDVFTAPRIDRRVSYPSRVMPGMRAHGHMGVDRVTVRNLKVLKIDSENHLILVKGAVPGGERRLRRDSQGRRREARAAAATAGKTEKGKEHWPDGLMA
jgi:large subunit ribosomal protein L3